MPFFGAQNIGPPIVSVANYTRQSAAPPAGGAISASLGNAISATEFGTPTSPAKTPATTLVGALAKRHYVSIVGNNNEAGNSIMGNAGEGFFLKTSGSVNGGGFLLSWVFSPSITRPDQVVAIGAWQAVGGIIFAGAPSATLANFVGLIKDQTDVFMQGFSVAAVAGAGNGTKKNLGIKWEDQIGKLCSLTLSSPKGGAVCNLTFANLETGLIATAALSATMPVADQELRPWFLIDNGTLTNTPLAVDFLRCSIQEPFGG